MSHPCYQERYGDLRLFGTLDGFSHARLGTMSNFELKSVLGTPDLQFLGRMVAAQGLHTLNIVTSPLM